MITRRDLEGLAVVLIVFLIITTVIYIVLSSIRPIGPESMICIETGKYTTCFY